MIPPDLEDVRVRVLEQLVVAVQVVVGRAVGTEQGAVDKLAGTAVAFAGVEMIVRAIKIAAAV